MFKQYQYKIICLVLCVVLFASCEKWDDYKKNQESGEKIYPGTFTNAKTFPGKNRALLTWNPSIDPSVTRYVVCWNNGADSLMVSANSHNPTDTVKIIVSNLPEQTHSFTVFAYDADGNRSVPKNINNVKVYGASYNAGLLNRIYKTYDYSNNVLALVWGVPDTIYVHTEVQYTDISGATKTAWLRAGNDTLYIPDWKEFTTLYYKSSYLPTAQAIDTFNVANYDSLKLIYKYEGVYHATGVRANYNADGSFAGNTAIDLDKELNKTATSYVYETDDIANLHDFADTKVILTINADNTIDISGYIGNTNPVANHPTAGKSYFDPVTKEIILRYMYTNANGTYRLMEERWVSK